MHAQSGPWSGVHNAGINSHQPGDAWCRPGTFVVALDLDGPRNYSAHDSPVIGQTLCAGHGSGSNRWGDEPFWVGVERAGINSHQPGRWWCPPGTYVVALDLDGPRDYSAHDSPVVGQALCAAPRSGPGRWGTAPFWVGVHGAGINSHQPGGPWCPSGTFVVALDLDGPRNYSAHDSPVIGQAACAGP